MRGHSCPERLSLYHRRFVGISSLSRDPLLRCLLTFHPVGTGCVLSARRGAKISARQWGRLPGGLRVTVSLLFSPTWRGEVCERTVRTMRAPLGAGVAAVSPPAGSGYETRNTAFTVHRPSDISSGANQASPMVFTKHETRDTNHGHSRGTFDTCWY